MEENDKLLPMNGIWDTKTILYIVKNGMSGHFYSRNDITMTLGEIN